MVLRSPTQNPPDVGPPATVPRRVRISLLVGMRVMNPVCGDPLNWTTFQGQRAARYQKVFHDPGHVITTVRQQSMKPHTDAQTAGDPVENDCANDCLPAPKEKRCDSSSMACNQENSGAPADSFVMCCRRSGYSFRHWFSSFAIYC